jgi:hypothetical protein
MSPAPPDSSSVRAAEVIGALCLATDLGMGFAFEHGLQSTLVASRLGERLGIDRETASQTYYACLLAYCGCTADADTAAQIFGGELTTHFVPVMWGSQRQAMAGLLRALPTPGHPAPVRAIQIARRLPQAAQGEQAAPRRPVRGRADADRAARPAPAGAEPLRPSHRALGRQGRARSREA